jgi:O-antigen/teichoic acid export membrane protein
MMQETDQSEFHRQIVKGSLWVFALRIIQQGFNMIRLIILARLLLPDDFGLIGIALLTMSILETFSQTGFQQALIQKKDDIRPYLDTAWSFLVLRGVFLCLFLYFLAPYAANFFRTPGANNIIRLVGLAILLQSFSNIGIIYFPKDLEFNKQFLYESSALIVDFTVAVTIALIYKNVWALLLGYLAGNLTRTVMSYLLHPYRPRFIFDFQKAKKLFGFGKWVVSSNILIFFITQGNDILIGRLLGVYSLGLYQMANRISNLPATEVTHVISQVTFPTYSKLQDNRQGLKDLYLKVIRIISFIVFPIGGLIFVLAPDFTRIFLGEKWMPMVPAVKILSLFGVVRSLGATVGPILYSTGRPSIQAKLSGIQLLFMALIIYPLITRWDITGASWAILLPNILALFMIIGESQKIVLFRYGEILKIILVPAIAVLAMLTVLLFIQLRCIPSKVGTIYFFASGISGAVVYLAFVFIGDKWTGHTLRRDLKAIAAICGS